MIFCFFKTFNNSFEISSSINGVIFSEYSITVTSEPNLLYTCPSSNPITPPPIIVKFLGISLRESASVDVIILSLSTLIKGRDIGFEPVAITHFLKLITSLHPSIFILFLSIKLALPLNTDILFLFIKKSIPLTVWFTTLFFLSIILLKFKLTFPLISIP